MEPLKELHFKWSGKEFTLPVLGDETVGSLKHKIQEHTLVQPKRQKLLGLKAKSGKLPADDDLLLDLRIRPGQKILLMGAPEEVIEASDRQADSAPDIQDDFNDIVDEEEDEELKGAATKNWQIDQTSASLLQEKISRRLKAVDVPILNPPRAGKKCLVLDIDYTIFDLGSAAERPEELARPYLLEMLSAVYPYYDILIWSANSLKWIEVKMRELRVSNHPDFKITSFLDGRCMVPVRTEKRGMFNCKPLSLLWRKFPEFYNEHNTIMLDDLRRNFICNKQNGLVIRPFKSAHITKHTDRELLYLKAYLIKIANLDSLSSLRHSRWESYIHQEMKELKAQEMTALSHLRHL